MNDENGLTSPSGLRPPTLANGGVLGDAAAMAGHGSGGSSGSDGSGGSGGTGSFRCSGAGSREAVAATTTAAAVPVSEIGFEGGGKIPYRESKFSPRRGRRKRHMGVGDDGCDNDVVSEACRGHESPRCDRLFELGDRLQRRVLLLLVGWSRRCCRLLRKVPAVSDWSEKIPKKIGFACEKREGSRAGARARVCAHQIGDVLNVPHQCSLLPQTFAPPYQARIGDK